MKRINFEMGGGLTSRWDCVKKAVAVGTSARDNLHPTSRC